MTCEQMGNLELDVEIDGSSIKNDFYFSYLTIDTNEDDDFGPFDVPEESTLEYIEFKEDISIELYESVPLPTLEQLAAFVVAIESWRQVMNSENARRSTCLCPIRVFLMKEHNDVTDLLDHLPLPGCIRKLVKKCLDQLKKEINAWIRYYKHLIPKPLKISDLMYCAWLSEGKIDYRKTALNMLSNPEMNSFDRFKIMSEYCLEDEINKLSPDSIPERIIRRKKFSRNSLLYYWFFYMNHDLDKLRRRNGQSIEAFMISSIPLAPWSAIEYFWDRLNINEQISAALVLLKQYPYFQSIQRQIFSKLNQFQQYYVLSAIPFNIIFNFYHEKFYHLAVVTMVKFGKVLTFEEFEELLLVLLQNSIFNEDQHEALLHLAKLWNCSSNDYKNRALQSLAEDVIYIHSMLFLRQHEIPNVKNTDFLVAFLSSGSVDFRRNIIFNHGTELVLSCDPSGIDRVIRLCIPDTKDMALFENHLLRSNLIESHCLSMLDDLDGDLQQLADFLHYFISNSDEKIKFICRIVVLDGNGFHLDDPLKRWNNAIEFIDNYFKPASVDQIMKYKKDIVWTFVNFHTQCRCDYKELHQFIQTITQVLEDDLLKKYKSVALKIFQRQCRWLEFDKIKIHQFLLWCLNYDYVEMKRFVKSLPIDRIFWRSWNNLKKGRFFEEERSRQAVSERFTPIDKMLLWYFEKSDRVKEFKLEKVFEFRHNRPAMFVKEGAVHEVFARNVLPWFFDGDREEIRKFKELYENDDIGKLIDID